MIEVIEKKQLKESCNNCLSFNFRQNTPPLLSEAKVGDECRLFFTETIDNQ